jgi:FkbM family methyltransferase
MKKTGKKIFLDIGGHDGQTLNEIASGRYDFDEIYCFEPMPTEYNILVDRFKDNNVKICNFGLLDKTEERNIYGTNRDMGASIYQEKYDLDNKFQQTLCSFIEASIFFKNNISENDLVTVKLNCEGSEILILNNLLESNEIFKIDNAMIDFDIRKVIGHQHEAQLLLNSFNEKGFKNYCLENDVMIGDTHENRIANWLTTLPYYNQILKPNDVTVVLTACNRPDLLEKTLDSFFEMNTYPIKRFIIIDDGMNFGCNDFVKTKYEFPIEIIYNDPKLFQIKSIDKVYSIVDTKYIFHMEEDWLFLKKGFIEDSMKVLEADDNILQVWLRGIDDETANHPWEEGVYTIDELNMVLLKYTGIWNGFSFNPGLKRYSDWKKLRYRYDGCDRITPAEQSGGVTLECDISVEYAKRGMIAMRFLESYITHIGWDRHIIEGIDGK